MPAQRCRNAASCRRVGQAGDPGLAGIGARGVGVAGNGQGAGAAQQGRDLGQRRGGTLRQHVGLVGVGGDGLLPVALQQGLVRPVRVVVHEAGDFRRRRRAGGQQAVIQHQLLGHRIGVAGGGGLGVGPVVGADGGDRVARRPTGLGRARPGRADSAARAGNARTKTDRIGRRMGVSSATRPCGASSARLACALRAEPVAPAGMPGRTPCSRDRSSR